MWISTVRLSAVLLSTVRLTMMQVSAGVWPLALGLGGGD